jgi:hypothetical protein
MAGVEGFAGQLVQHWWFSGLGWVVTLVMSVQVCVVYLYKNKGNVTHCHISVIVLAQQHWPHAAIIDTKNGTTFMSKSGIFTGANHREQGVFWGCQQDRT